MWLFALGLKESVEVVYTPKREKIQYGKWTLDSHRKGEFLLRRIDVQALYHEAFCAVERSLTHLGKSLGFLLAWLRVLELRRTLWITLPV